MQEALEEAEDWHPFKHQETAIKTLLEVPQSGLLLDPGMCKTSSTLAAYKLRLMKKQVRRVLVVAPLKPAYEVWPAEVCKWKDFHSYRIAVVHGTVKERMRTLRALTPAHNLVIVNPEGLQWLLGDRERRRLLDADALVIDESSKFKSHSALRFRVLRSHLRQFKYRTILTGSPRPRNYEDLWAQVYILDQGAALGPYITHYRNKYFYPTGYQMREWALLPGAEEKINEAVSHMLMRLDPDEYVKIPKPEEVMHYVTLPDKVQSAYDRIESDLMSDLFDGPMLNSSAARSKLCQMANGSVYLDDAPKRAVQVIHTEKTEALADLVEELQGEPLLVAIGYHHDVAAIRSALGYEVPTINSKTTNTQASEFIRQWNRGELPVLLGHPASMGHGTNMQKASCRHVAFFDIPDDYDLFDQFFRRVCRTGNKSSSVVRHIFATRDTVDIAKLKALRQKGRGQGLFLEAMRKYTEQKYGQAPAVKRRKGTRK
jgi:hypothetical protein